MDIENYRWVEPILKKQFKFVGSMRIDDYSEELAIVVGYKDSDKEWIKRYPIWLVVDGFDINKESNPEYWLQSVAGYIKMDFKTRCWK